MTTFLAIILGLLIINVALLVFSNSNSKVKVGKLTKSISEQQPTKIYPLDLSTSKYKKAI